MNGRKNRGPRDCVVIVAAIAADVDPAAIRGEPIRDSCSDCHKRIIVDSVTRDDALAMPELKDKPLRYLCPTCAKQYEIADVHRILDYKRTSRKC